MQHAHKLRCAHTVPLQLINVSRDEDAPEDVWAAQEDMRLFCADMVDKHGQPRELLACSDKERGDARGLAHCLQRCATRAAHIATCHQLSLAHPILYPAGHAPPLLSSPASSALCITSDF